MTTNTPHGAKPGKETPKKIAVGGNAHTTTVKVFTAKIIAFTSWVQAAALRFCLRWCNSLDLLALGALVAVWSIWGVLA